MKELSLNILDIAQNSVSAKASEIEITVEIDHKKNEFRLTIIDNGKGMTEEFLKTVTDPFTTTRTTRKVGMGISLLKLAAEQAGGGFDIQSKIGCGTTVTAVFQNDHIDRAPLGEIGQTISALASCNEEIDFVYRHVIDGQEFIFDTKQIKAALGGVSLKEPDVVLWMQDYITEGIKKIGGGAEI